MEGRTSVTTRRRSVPKRDQPWQYLRRPSVVTSLNALLSLGIWRRQTAIFGFSPLTKYLLFINAVLIQPRVALYDTPERKKWEKTNVWRREDFSREACIWNNHESRGQLRDEVVITLRAAKKSHESVAIVLRMRKWGWSVRRMGPTPPTSLFCCGKLREGRNGPIPLFVWGPVP